MTLEQKWSRNEKQKNPHKLPTENLKQGSSLEKPHTLKGQRHYIINNFMSMNQQRRWNGPKSLEGTNYQKWLKNRNRKPRNRITQLSILKIEFVSINLHTKKIQSQMALLMNSMKLLRNNTNPVLSSVNNGEGNTFQLILWGWHSTDNKIKDTV